jgi:ABC-type transporter Mla MlaB component
MGRHEGLGPGYAPVLADGFLVHVVRHDECFHVVVGGELDQSTSGALERQIETFVDPSSTVVLSLRDVTSIDAAGTNTCRPHPDRSDGTNHRLRLRRPGEDASEDECSGRGERTDAFSAPRVTPARRAWRVNAR